MASALRLSLFLLLLGALACAPGPDNPGDGDDTADAGDDAPDGGDDSQTELIGPEGGTVTANGVTLTIPPGALSEPVAITVDKTSATPPQDVTALSSFYEFGPAGTQFLVPVTVTLTAGAALPAGAKVYWSKAGGAPGFDALSATVSGQSASAQVSHFSVGFIGAVTDNGGGGDGTCSQQEELARTVLAPYAPVASLGPQSGPARLMLAGGAIFLQYGGGHLTNGAKPYGSTTYVSTDGRAFSLVGESLFGSSGEAGTLVDTKTGDLYAFINDSSDLHFVRRAPGGCGERVGTIEGAWLGGSAPLAMLPDGRIFGIVRKRSPDVYVAVFSSDKGATWTEASETGRGTMAEVAPSDPSRIYVGRGYNSVSLAQLATSRDGGATWESVRVPSGTSSSGTSTVQSIAVDPANADVVYALTVGSSPVGLYKSTDGGASFPTEQKVTAVPGAVNTIVFGPDGALWASTGAGLFKRGATDADWTGLNAGVPAEELNTYAVGFKQGEIWRLDAQLRKSTDGGQSWSVVPVAGFPDLESREGLTDPTNDKVFYADHGHLDFSGTAYRTTDGGRSFTSFTVGGVDGYGQGTVDAVTGNGVLLSLVSKPGQVGMRSTDRGETWTPMSGLPLNAGWFHSEDGKGMHAHRTGGYAYLLDNSTNLYRSTDDGATWSHVRKLGKDSQWGGTTGVKVIVDPTTPGRFFYVDMDGATHELHVTTDGGETSTKIEPPVGVTANWSEAKVDWDGRLWATANKDFEASVLTVEPGATTVTDRTPASGVMGVMSVLGRRVLVGQSLTTDGGATWTTLDPVAAYVAGSFRTAFVHRANGQLVFINAGGLRTGLLQ